MQLNNFHYAMTLLEQLYGISLQDDIFEEIALVAWNHIGNKRYKIYRYLVCLDCDNMSVELPCNADTIEAVTTSFEDWNHVTNYTPNGDINSSIIEEYIEGRKAFHDPLYASGKFVKYERVGNTLYFSEPYRRINILYRGELLDEEGLPEITDKEALAIATYCAYTHKFKEGLMSNNRDVVQLANVLKQQWLVQCDLARVPEHLSQNELDEILDVKASWTRKQFGKSFKVYN